jgi:hypothetical protein
MPRVTVDLSPKMNLEVTVNRRKHAPTKRGQAVVAGSIEIRHPSYVEHFELYVKGRDLQHTWMRLESDQLGGIYREPASITECLLLWSIYNA